MERATATCHSRWCPAFFPNFSIDEGFRNELCRDVNGTIYDSASRGGDPTELLDVIVACCRLFCGESSSQLLQLQCQNIRERTAILTWFLVIFLVLCAMIQLVSVCLERGARKVAMIGGPMYLAFVAIIVYILKDNVGLISTPYYPIVGAMNVAAFSYYFSSFQYSIGLTYELASISALVVTMFPVWTILTRKVDDLQNLNVSDIEPSMLEGLVKLVVAMLASSIIWVTHSSLYRTIGYKAAWITAVNKQVAEGHALPFDKSYLSRLWMLAGAQGHPTWRTAAGQSIGLYLSSLSWIISVSIHILLRKECKEDLILFHILLWVPPSFLTMALLMTQIATCVRASHQENGEYPLQKWYMAEFQFLKETYQHMEEATISYRLGRDSFEVEEKIERYRLQFYDGQIRGVDKFVAVSVFFIEGLILVFASPGILLLTSIQWLGKCLLRCNSRRISTPTTIQSADSESIPSTLNRPCPILYWLLRPLYLEVDLDEEIQAYRILCEYCFSEEASEHYESSRFKDNDFLNINISEEICKIFRRHLKDIRLSLLLDNIGPSRLLYLLQNLAYVINESTKRNAEMTILTTSIPSEGVQGPLVMTAANEDNSEVMPIIRGFNETS